MCINNRGGKEDKTRERKYNFLEMYVWASAKKIFLHSSILLLPAPNQVQNNPPEPRNKILLKKVTKMTNNLLQITLIICISKIP